MLLESGASIKARAQDLKTVTMLATMDGGDVLVVDLVNQQAMLDKKDEAGWSVLFFACEAGRIDLVKWLLKRTEGKKPEINVRDKAKDGTSILMVTAQSGHKKIGDLLLNQKASVNAKCLSGVTALMLSIKAQRVEFADWLMLKHADITMESDDGETAINIAESQGLNVLANRLIQKLRQDDGTAGEDDDALA